MNGGRRAKRKGGAPVPGKPRARRRTHPAARLGLIATAVVVLGVAGWMGFGPTAARREAARAPRTVAEALDSAAAAIAGGDYDRAFAIYRAAIREHPDASVLVGSYAAAVNNRSFAVRPSRGRLVPLAPTSHDRVATALEVLALYAEAERLHPEGGDAALQRGITYASWGLPEDALFELYRAKMQGGRQPEIDGIGTTITLLQLGQGDVVDAQAIRPSRAAP